MNALSIVVLLEVPELLLMVLRVPKEDVVEVFTTDRSNQSLKRKDATMEHMERL